MTSTSSISKTSNSEKMGRPPYAGAPDQGSTSNPKSRMEKKDGSTAVPPLPSPATVSQCMYTTKNEIKFPFRLHQVLEESEKEGFTHIISWLPEGDGFRIVDPIAFAKEIMPRYFSMGHYKSLQRQLSLYSFKRETEGPKRDAYCHPMFRRENRDLCIFIPREKKRQPKNKKSRRNRNGMRRNTQISHEVPSHRRALSSEEVAEMMNSPSVSPIPEDFINTNNTGSMHPLFAPAAGVVLQKHPAIPVTSNDIQQHPEPQQGTSFFAEADPSPYQLEQRQRPALAQQLHLQQHESSLPAGRPLQFPIKGKASPSNKWMQQHDQSLWNYVNGLVVDSTKTFNDKNDLQREASNFSTDEILSEIASTFKGNEQSQGSSSINSICSSQNSVLAPSPAHPSLPQ